MPASLVRRCLLFVLAASIPASLRAAPQDPTKPPVFEVVSVKLDRDCSGGPRPVITPGRAEISCVSARALIRIAYSAFTGSELASRRVNVLGGPAWMDSDFYQIAGKTSAQASAADILGPMLRAVLEDRFKLKVHKEPRETSVYLLTVAEANPNLRPIKDGDCVPMDIFAELSGSGPSRAALSGSNPSRAAISTCGGGRGKSKGELTAYDLFGVTMEEFAGRMISSYTDRPVIDKTGLAGRYSPHLEFAPPRPQGTVIVNGQPVTVPPAPDDSGPSIYTALQKQLGLKLTPGKAPLDVIVVDSIERPSEN